MEKRYCILSYKVLILAIICCFINANAQAAPILKLNSHGHDVIVLQQNLIRMNYDLSKVSGNYDKETQEAVKAFQKDHKIKVTGIVNRETWRAIKGGKQNVIVNSQSSINEKIILDNLSSVPYGRQFLSKKEVPGIIATAKDYIGVPYVFGGDTPAGFDCSGYFGCVRLQHGKGSAERRYAFDCTEILWTNCSDCFCRRLLGDTQAAGEKGTGRGW